MSRQPSVFGLEPPQNDYHIDGSNQEIFKQPELITDRSLQISKTGAFPEIISALMGPELNCSEFIEDIERKLGEQVPSTNHSGRKWIACIFCGNHPPAVSEEGESHRIDLPFIPDMADRLFGKYVMKGNTKESVEKRFDNERPEFRGNAIEIEFGRHPRKQKRFLVVIVRGNINIKKFLVDVQSGA